MDFKLEVVKGIPVVYSDEFYDEEEIQMMYNEAEKIRRLGLFNTESTGGAKVEVIDEATGKPKVIEELSNNQTAWLNKMYSGEPRLSDILNITSKVFDEKLIEYLTGINPFFKTMKFNRNTGTLLTYYDESEYYKNHVDIFFVTVLTWIYKEPKVFEGGEFVIEDELTIDCVRGRIVFMPSYALHKVLPVTMPKDKQGKGLGRYSISQFIDK